MGLKKVADNVLDETLREATKGEQGVAAMPANAVIEKIMGLVACRDRFKYGKTWYAGISDPDLSIEAGVSFIRDELSDFLAAHKAQKKLDAGKTQE